MKRRCWRSVVGVIAIALGCWVGAQAQTAVAASAPAASAPSALSSLAVLDFELVDERNNPLTHAAEVVRLHDATVHLRQELADRQLYRVVDPAPAQALLQKLRDQQEYLYRCDDCAEQIGKALGVDLVMVTWVQKVSELILNLNVQIYDVKAQRVVFTKSVDMRGNNDVSWRRAVPYLVRDMAEKRARNPRYGL
ncbi:hypothetical protein BH11PSE8_BH11PSE8_31600 [soil metagenome]